LYATPLRPPLLRLDEELGWKTLGLDLFQPLALDLETTVVLENVL
jgi:hypothetical protein